jgi:16S rRNA (cytosine1402-N4)-methyltransferase
VQQPTHIPVLLETVLEILAPRPGEAVLDVTLGLGGHSLAFLQTIGSAGHLTALEADTTNLELAKKRLADEGFTPTVLHANFQNIGSLHLEPVDVLFADLGLSSPHLDDPERGFSFRFEGPLDLRFDRSQGVPASELIRHADDESLKGLFRMYGELFREAGKLGRMLAEQDLPTTTALKNLIEKGFGYHARHILPQVFQALRIAVNDEIATLANLLAVGPTLLKPGGRMGVLSYHSLEDRMVKQTFKALCEPEKDPVTGKISVPASFEMLTKKAMQASDEEIATNPRARSVKFRAIRKRTD